ncbi:hypothetical protein C2L64_48860 [Paraburkholderia hospita]|uniref:Uncharacterized protein n=1 Tax=Paraburkholderia hospita TaxID=169430 RepID=A0AAN1MRF6_9BURK|nr:hypothetical protein C2L64_48860 [Paraburkholderia hospita]
MCSPALAGEHYIEVWNPTEARGRMEPAHTARKTSKQRQRVSDPLAHERSHHRVVAAVPGPNASVANVGRRTHEPRYEDIPRQLAPEDNVLRVDGQHARTEVER